MRNRCASRSRATPRPSSATVIATWTPSRAAVTRMGEDSGACRAALENRVVQHLDDAPPVGHRARQVRRQVDRHAVPAAAAQEGVPGPVHQGRDVDRLGVYRERARVDAPDIQQVADQAAHVIGLIVDDAEELAHLGRVELRSGIQRGGGRPLDRGQRRAQLVAHHAQELGPQALQLLERREVLQGDHHRLDRAVRRTDRRRVDQRGDAAPVRDRELDLLRAHRLGIAELVGERELVEPDLAPVAAPAGHDLQQLLRRAVRTAQLPDDPPRLAVERHRTAGRSIEHHHPDRRGVDQDLQVGPGPLLVAVRAGVGDRRRRLRGEQHQVLLVLLRERPPAFLLAEKEVADMHPPVAHRHGLQGLRQPQLLGIAERAEVGRHVRQPQRPRKVPEMLEERVAVRPLRQPLYEAHGAQRTQAPIAALRCDAGCGGFDPFAWLARLFGDGDADDAPEQPGSRAPVLHDTAAAQESATVSPAPVIARAPAFADPGPSFAREGDIGVEVEDAPDPLPGRMVRLMRIEFGRSILGEQRYVRVGDGGRYDGNTNAGAIR